MSKFRTKPWRIALAAIAVAVGVAASPLVTQGFAFASPLLRFVRTDVPYGGLILASFPCTMTSYGMPALYLLVLDYRFFVPVPTVLLPASRLNMWYAPIVGNAGLGTFMPVPGVCTISGTDYEPTVGFVSTWPLAGFGTTLVSPYFKFVAGALPV